MNSQHCGGLRNRRSAPFFVARQIIVISLILCSCGTARADWSPEIVLWQPEPGGVNPGSMRASMVVDSSENIHIVHEFRFAHPERPGGPPFTGLRYLRLDSNGQILNTCTISDSADDVNTYAQIALFAQDSLWIIWRSARQYLPPTHSSYEVRALDLHGQLLGVPRIFQEDPYGAIGFSADVRSDGAFALVYPQWAVEPNPGNLRVIVQLPDGNRMIDTAVVWTCGLCDQPSSFFDYADSLQIVWRENNFSFWNAIFGKRVASDVPFNPTSIPDHVELTPGMAGNWHSEPNIRASGTTRIVLREIGGEITGTQQNLSIFTRDGYDSISSTSAGASQGFTDDFAIEGDSIISIPAMIRGQDIEIHLLRFGLSNLQLLGDEIIANREDPNAALSCVGYSVSPMGQRHILMQRGVENQNLRLAYRYWRSGLSTSSSHPLSSSSEYSISPNPSHGIVSFSGQLASIREIRVYNILGQLAETISVPKSASMTSELSLSFDSLPAGVYILQIRTSSDHFIMRRIVLLP